MSDQQKTVKVINLPIQFEEQKLKKYFSKAGKINDFIVVGQECLITFDNQDACQKAKELTAEIFENKSIVITDISSEDFNQFKNVSKENIQLFHTADTNDKDLEEVQKQTIEAKTADPVAKVIVNQSMPQPSLLEKEDKGHDVPNYVQPSEKPPTAEFKPSSQQIDSHPDREQPSTKQTNRLIDEQPVPLIGTHDPLLQFQYSEGQGPSDVPEREEQDIPEKITDPNEFQNRDVAKQQGSRRIAPQYEKQGLVENVFPPEQASEETKQKLQEQKPEEQQGDVGQVGQEEIDRLKNLGITETNEEKLSQKPPEGQSNELFEAKTDIISEVPNYSAQLNQDNVRPGLNETEQNVGKSNDTVESGVDMDKPSVNQFISK